MTQHKHLKRAAPKPEDLWECKYCKQKGKLRDIINTPCEHKGETLDFVDELGEAINPEDL